MTMYVINVLMYENFIAKIVNYTLNNFTLTIFWCIENTGNFQIFFDRYKIEFHKTVSIYENSLHKLINVL